MYMKFINSVFAIMFMGGLIFPQNPLNIKKSIPVFYIDNSSFFTKEDLSSRRKWEFERQRDPYSNKIPENIFNLERKFAENLPNDKTMKLKKGNREFLTDEWVYRGPYNQGGRSRSVAVDVNNLDIVLAGGTTGGMWRSTNNGQSWVKVTPADDSIQTVTCVVQDTRIGKTNTWYYGTGEYSSNLELQDNGAGFTTFLGSGIYKSTDNGLSWTRLISTSPNYSPTFSYPFQLVWNIAVDISKIDLDIVYAAVYGSIYRSTDGGDSWSVVLGEQNNSIYTNVSVTSNGEVYAALSNGMTQGIWHSSDGINWQDITPEGFPSVYSRIVIANAPSDSDILYILANTPGSGTAGSSSLGLDDYHNLWKFDASNGNWTDLSNSLPDCVGEVGGYSSQLSYNMVIKVSPNDPELVIIGGTNLYRTTDGFKSKLDSQDWIGGYSPINDVSSYPNQHADEHDLYFLPSNPDVLYSAHDGGLSYTNNIRANEVVWSSMNNGFSTTQFYSVALDHATKNSPLIVGGMQDNGNMMNTTSDENANWTILPYGGDGCISAVADGGEYIYFSTQNGNIMEGRLADQQGALIVPEGASGFLFVTPYVLDPSDNKIIYVAAGNHIWRNSDVLSIPIGTETPTTINWTDMNNIDITQLVSALSVSKEPQHILYYGTNNGRVFKVINSHEGNPASQEITSNIFPPGFVSSIAVDKQDADNILVVFANYNVISIFSTTDGGETWEAVSGNLEQYSDGSGIGPSVRTAKIINVDGEKIYYAGTSIGLFAATSLSGMETTWIQQATENIGMVDVEALDIREIDGTIVAGTFGNGVFSSSVNVTGVKEEFIPSVFSLSQNYPNPFNPTTTIKYSIPVETGHAPSLQIVTLKIYDVIGREVATLVNEQKAPGNYEVEFSAKGGYTSGGDGSTLSSGIYFYKLTAGSFTQTKKLMLMK